MHARQQGHRSFCRATVAPKAFMEEGRNVVRDIAGEIGKLVSGTESRNRPTHLWNFLYDKGAVSDQRGKEGLNQWS